jgi:ubiquinone/menaquinone biosynthesis C-methylase UbiE
MTMEDSTKRFSSRVENYVKYRPGYPAAILDLLEGECGLTTASAIADIGSGTGILTELFLKHGNRVAAVEPNAEMRTAAERALSHFPGFQSVVGTAEATTLPAQGVDIITASQAFHWFDRVRTRPEFVRILKPDCWLVLIWNDRKTAASPFLKAYEELLQTCATDYSVIDHKQIDAGVIRAFFEPSAVQLATFPNQQRFDFEGLKGRLLSSSYAPEPGHPKYQPMLENLAAIFRQHEEQGSVTFHYDTLVYYGRLA